MTGHWFGDPNSVSEELDIKLVNIYRYNIFTAGTWKQKSCRN